MGEQGDPPPNQQPPTAGWTTLCWNKPPPSGIQPSQGSKGRNAPKHFPANAVGTVPTARTVRRNSTVERMSWVFKTQAGFQQSREERTSVFLPEGAVDAKAKRQGCSGYIQLSSAERAAMGGP